MGQREDKFVLRWAKKYRAIQELGGKCARCGEENLFLLDFHHLNPATKDFGISTFVKHADWATIKAETSKCELLCLNCHRKEHQAKSILKFEKHKSEIMEKSKVLESISRPPIAEWEVKDLLQKGASLNSIAKLLGKDVSTIRSLAMRLEEKCGGKLYVNREQYISSVRKIRDEDLAEMLASGATIEEMKDRFGCARSTLYERIRNFKRQGA